MRPVRGLAIGVLALVCAGAAAAHGIGPHAGLNSTVVGTEPLIPGLLVTVVRAHEKLSVRNFTTKEVVLFDARGRPLARLASGERAEWADPRITWKGPIPADRRKLKDWRIAGEADGKPFAIVGFLGYVPPAGEPIPGGAGTSPWLIAGAIAVGVLALLGLGVGTRLAGRAPSS
jgi:hypothetical protein